MCTLQGLAKIGVLHGWSSSNDQSLQLSASRACIESCIQCSVLVMCLMASCLRHHPV